MFNYGKALYGSKAIYVLLVFAVLFAGCAFPSASPAAPDSNNAAEPVAVAIPSVSGCSINSECTDYNAATYDECVAGKCRHIPIKVCIGNDGYCPVGCYSKDSDCARLNCSAQGGKICPANESCSSEFALSRDSQRCCSAKCEIVPECKKDSDCYDADPSTKDSCSSSKCLYLGLAGSSHTYLKSKGDFFSVKGAGIFDTNMLNVKIADLYSEEGELFGLFRLFVDGSQIDAKIQGAGKLRFIDATNGRLISGSGIDIQEITADGSSKNAVIITNGLTMSYSEGDSFTVEGAGPYLGEKLSVLLGSIYQDGISMSLYSGQSLIAESAVNEGGSAVFENNYGEIVKTRISVGNIRPGYSAEITTKTESLYFKDENFIVVSPESEIDRNLSIKVKDIFIAGGNYYADFDALDDYSVLGKAYTVKAGENISGYFADYNNSFVIYAGPVFFGRPDGETNLITVNGIDYHEGDSFHAKGKVFVESKELAVQVYGINNGEVDLAVKDGSATVKSGTFGVNENVRFYDGNIAVMKNRVMAGTISAIPSYSALIKVTDFS